MKLKEKENNASIITIVHKKLVINRNLFDQKVAMTSQSIQGSKHILMSNKRLQIGDRRNQKIGSIIECVHFIVTFSKR